MLRSLFAFGRSLRVRYMPAAFGLLCIASFGVPLAACGTDPLPAFANPPPDDAAVGGKRDQGSDDAGTESDPATR
jgi:hypothetical protein